MPPQDLPPSKPPAPVLPYRGEDKTPRLPLPIAASVYRIYGIVSLTLAGTAWLLVAGGTYIFGIDGFRDRVMMGCCIGLLSWIVSTTLAASVIARDRGIGRRLALLAFVLDMLLLVAAIGVSNFR